MAQAGDGPGSWGVIAAARATHRRVLASDIDPVSVRVAGANAHANRAGGRITFLRAVHPYERAEMATVYSTYRQISDITAPMVYALILTFLPLPAVFACSGVVMLVMARIALHPLPSSVLAHVWR